MEALLVMSAAGGIAVLAAPFLRRDWSIVRQGIIACSFVVVMHYELWRLFNLPLDLSAYTLFCWAFFALEGVATYLAMEDFLLLKRTVSRSAEATANLDWYGTKAPRVDLIVATYNESWEVLEKTLIGATSVDYPNYAVWIFDDGNRPWLAQRAADLRVGYVTRTDNAHYKAGNLNSGLAELRRRGVPLEFLALMDADFIARPQFLRRTLSLMKDEGVGIVQTPQCFYNPDPHQQALGGVKCWPDEQRGWFDVYLPALDALGWASCCGTSCLIRFKALDVIGMFPTQSVCEDTLTSIKMGERGFRTVFLEEPLSVGLAPEGIGEFLTQRARWLLGGVQNHRYLGKGVGLRALVKYYLGLWRLAIWGVMPPLWVALCVLYWFTGISLIRVKSLDEALLYFGPLWLLRMFQGWLFSGRQQVFVSDSIWMLLAPLWVKETYRAVVGSKARFKVTDKAQHRERSVVHWQLLPFHGALAALLLAGLAYTAFDPSAPGHVEGLLHANTVMSVWFLLIMVAGLAPVFEPPRRRRADRYPTTETVRTSIAGEPATLRAVDISLGGVLLATSTVHVPDREIELELSDVGRVRARAVRRDSRGNTAFAFTSAEARPALVRKLYCAEGYVPTPTRWPLTTALAAFARRLVA